jgi:hypothetical protein
MHVTMFQIRLGHRTTSDLNEILVFGYYALGLFLLSSPSTKNEIDPQRVDYLALFHECHYRALTCKKCTSFTLQQGLDNI